ncbi:hypothetical protein P0F65_13955 [Sphingomonas sp. I4]
MAGGAWGFAATNNLTPDGIAAATRQAAAIAKANARIQSEPVQLAPVTGVGEVSWRTPSSRTRWRCRLRTRPTCCWASTPPLRVQARISSTRSCSSSTSRNTSPRPTARTSTRTCTVSGRR